MLTVTPSNWITRGENGTLTTKWVNNWKMLEVCDRPKSTFNTYDIVTIHGDPKGNDVKIIYYCHNLYAWKIVLFCN